MVEFSKTTQTMQISEISCDNWEDDACLVREFLCWKNTYRLSLVRACAFQHLRIIFRCRQLNQFFSSFRFFLLNKSSRLFLYIFYSSLLVTNIFFFVLFTILSSVVVHCYISVVEEKPVSNAHTIIVCFTDQPRNFFHSLDDTKKVYNKNTTTTTTKIMWRRKLKLYEGDDYNHESISMTI